MTVIRTRTLTDNFTVVSNHTLDDGRLDWDEVGLLMYLASKPPTWNVSVTQLCKIRKSGRDKIYRMLRNLRENGYVRYVSHDTGGGEYIVDPCGFPDGYGKPVSGKPVSGKSVSIVSNDLELRNKTTVSNEKPKDLCSSGDERFTEWYSIWPRKMGKQAALRHWKRIKCDAIADRIIQHTRDLVRIQYAHLIARKDTQLIPHASTYINNQRWEDDIIPPGPSDLTEDESHGIRTQQYKEFHRRLGEGAIHEGNGHSLGNNGQSLPPPVDENEWGSEW